MSTTTKLLGFLSGAALAFGGIAYAWITKTDSGFRWVLDRMYEREFPDVPLIHPDELSLVMRSGAHPLMLDARNADEYAVSHLRGAQLAEPSAFNDSDVAGIDRDRPVVVYCSVGYRSAKLARRLRALGFHDVRNLYGGLFYWYNQGRPVVRGEQEVEAVHPYDFVWGQFITRAGKTYRP